MWINSATIVKHQKILPRSNTQLYYNNGGHNNNLKIAHLSAEDMLKSADIEEKKFKNIISLICTKVNE